FLIVDGVMPANDGRGYVLRRIIRRAVRHGYTLGIREPFFYKLTPVLVEVMGEAYPELPRAQQQVERILKQEEERIRETLEQGIRLLEEALQTLDSEVIPGELVFRLYDTYGFPVDLTNDVARERGLSLDFKGFDAAMAAQRARARAASRFDVQMPVGEGEPNLQSEFRGYEQHETTAPVVALYREGRSVKTLEEGEEGGIILAATPFYAESGGQVGDTGEL